MLPERVHNFVLNDPPGHTYLTVAVVVSVVCYSLFMPYRTQFSQVFSYIIELRKKNMRVM